MEEKRETEIVKQATEATATALNIQYIQRDILEIKQELKDSANKLESTMEELAKRDENFVRKEEFVFWRNLLVSGMLLTIFLGAATSFINK